MIHLSNFKKQFNLNLIPWLILLAGLVSGQLIKFSSQGSSGPILLDLSVILFDILALINLKFQLKKPPVILKLIFLFIIVSFISIIFTPLVLNTDEYINSLSYSVRFISYIFMGWLIYSQAFKVSAKSIINMLIFSGFILAILGILQLIFIPNLGFLSESGWDPHYFRTVSTLLDPNFAGSYFALTLLLMISQYGNFIRKKFWIIIFVVVYLALITTFSRTATLVLAVSFFTYSLLKKSVQMFLLTLVLLLGIGLGYIMYNHQIAKPRNIDRQQSAAFRLSAWEQGWQIFLKAPLLGVGFNSYRFAVREYRLGETGFLSSRGSSTNDSSLLFVASTTGIIGLITYLIILFSLEKEALKNHFQNKRAGTLLASALPALLLASFFINILFYPLILVWVILTASQINTD